MIQALLWIGIAVGSFAAAAVLVFAMVRVTERRDDRAGFRRAVRTDVRMRAARQLRPRSEPAWWPEFERAFADYVRAGERRRS